VNAVLDSELQLEKRWEEALPSYHDMVDFLEEAMVDNLELIDPDNHTAHNFTPGIYIRTMTLPAGMYVTSLVHRDASPFIFLQGAMTLYTEDGGEQFLEAPYTGITPAGARRCAYTHTPVVWITFHPNPDELRDPQELTSMITVFRENPRLVGKMIQSPGQPYRPLQLEEVTE